MCQSIKLEIRSITEDEKEVIRRYIRSAAESAEFAGSVRTGALILAAVGLLKGKPATTHWAYYKILESLGSPYQRKRWVKNG